MTDAGLPNGPTMTIRIPPGQEVVNMPAPPKPGDLANTTLIFVIPENKTSIKMSGCIFNDSLIFRSPISDLELKDCKIGNTLRLPLSTTQNASIQGYGMNYSFCFTDEVIPADRCTTACKADNGSNGNKSAIEDMMMTGDWSIPPQYSQLRLTHVLQSGKMILSKQNLRDIYIEYAKSKLHIQLAD